MFSKRATKRRRNIKEFNKNKQKKEMLVAKEVKEHIETKIYINNQIAIFETIPHIVIILMEVESKLEELGVEEFKTWTKETYKELSGRLGEITGTMESELNFVLFRIAIHMKLIPSKQRTVRKIKHKRKW